MPNDNYFPGSEGFTGFGGPIKKAGKKALGFAQKGAEAIGGAAQAVGALPDYLWSGNVQPGDKFAALPMPKRDWAVADASQVPTTSTKWTPPQTQTTSTSTPQQVEAAPQARDVQTSQPSAIGEGLRVPPSTTRSLGSRALASTQQASVTSDVGGDMGMTQPAFMDAETPSWWDPNIAQTGMRNLSRATGVDVPAVMQQGVQRAAEDEMIGRNLFVQGREQELLEGGQRAAFNRMMMEYMPKMRAMETMKFLSDPSVRMMYLKGTDKATGQPIYDPAYMQMLNDAQAGMMGGQGQGQGEGGQRQPIYPGTAPRVDNQEQSGMGGALAAGASTAARGGLGVAGWKAGGRLASKLAPKAGKALGLGLKGFPIVGGVLGAGLEGLGEQAFGVEPQMEQFRREHPWASLAGYVAGLGIPFAEEGMSKIFGGKAIENPVARENMARFAGRESGTPVDLSQRIPESRQVGMGAMGQQASAGPVIDVQAETMPRAVPLQYPPPLPRQMPPSETTPQGGTQYRFPGMPTPPATQPPPVAPESVAPTAQTPIEQYDLFSPPARTGTLPLHKMSFEQWKQVIGSGGPRFAGPTQGLADLELKALYQKYLTSPEP